MQYCFIAEAEYIDLCRSMSRCQWDFQASRGKMCHIKSNKYPYQKANN